MVQNSIDFDKNSKYNSIHLNSSHWRLQEMQVKFIMSPKIRGKKWDRFI